MKNPRDDQQEEGIFSQRPLNQFVSIFFKGVTKCNLFRNFWRITKPKKKMFEFTWAAAAKFFLFLILECFNDNNHISLLKYPSFNIY